MDETVTSNSFFSVLHGIKSNNVLYRLEHYIL